MEFGSTMDEAGDTAIAAALAPHAVASTRKTGSSSTEGWLGALQRTASIGPDPFLTLPALIDHMAQAHGDSVALIGARGSFTYRQLVARQRRYARWALQEGLRRGDTVCLLMPNRPEYLAIWLGLTQVGIVVALLNTNLTEASLAHCITVAGPKSLIVAADLLATFDSAAPHVRGTPAVWVHGESAMHPRIDTALCRMSDDPLPRDEAATLADPALLIFTSGTTGLPKAAHVGHHRLMTWSQWFAGLIDTRMTDRMYNCLPLYHSIGGVVAVGNVLVSGGSVVVAEKFSASQFWHDVVTHECTLFQYIGELCRYLVAAPPNPLETKHRLRLCAGNGLRADVWEAFQQRFAIPRILEFYASTEGTVSFYNVEGQIGSIGRVPSFMAHRSAAALVRHDLDNGEPLRDPNGFCARVAIGETGELIGRVGGEKRPGQRFEGYTSAADSARKILRDVFEPGDAWFRTGDLLRQDRKGFFYFADRVGDTFRWKGENVSTAEVAEALGRAAGVEEAVVYGVEVPATEGRAGMAALRTTAAFDLVVFREDLAQRLPAYARPVFLRLCTAFDATETFKLKKGKLVEAGFDPARTDDALYVDDRAAGAYVAIDQRCHEAINQGRLRV